jgi:hypothetical protein
MSQLFGKSQSTSGSNFLQQKSTPNPSQAGGKSPVEGPQEILETRRLFQNIGLPPMAKSAAPVENIFSPPADEKKEELMSSSPFKQPAPDPSKPEKKEDKRYDIPFHQHEIDLLAQLSDFTKSAHFKPFESPRSRRSLTGADGTTVLEELAQDFSTRTLTTRQDGSSEQIRDRLGRLIYEKFQEGSKWTARLLQYHDQAGKKSPFVMALKSLSSDGRFREIQYSKLGQIESEKETLYDLKLV